jgi:hypothetical protein
MTLPIVSDVPPLVREVLGSSGKPLDPAWRRFMEPRFGQDFGRVRVHTDAKAVQSARAVNALAYTVGSHIVLDEQPGRWLLAHVVEHRNFPASASLLARSDHPSENDANQVADRIVNSPERSVVTVNAITGSQVLGRLERTNPFGSGSKSIQMPI